MRFQVFFYETKKNFNTLIFLKTTLPKTSSSTFAIAYHSLPPLNKVDVIKMVCISASTLFKLTLCCIYIYALSICMLYVFECCIYMHSVFLCTIYVYVCCMYTHGVFIYMVYLYVCSLNIHAVCI